MRKRFRVLILAAVVVAVVVPFGLALSLEPSAPVTPAAVRITGSVPVQSTVVALATGAPSLTRRATPFFAGLPDGAKLLLMGAVLFGLAAALKKAVYSLSRPLISAPRTYNRDISAR